MKTKVELEEALCRRLDRLEASLIPPEEAYVKDQKARFLYNELIERFYCFPKELNERMVIR